MGERPSDDHLESVESLCREFSFSAWISPSASACTSEDSTSEVTSHNRNSHYSNFERPANWCTSLRLQGRKCKYIHARFLVTYLRNHRWNRGASWSGDDLEWPFPRSKQMCTFNAIRACLSWVVLGWFAVLRMLLS